MCKQHFYWAERRQCAVDLIVERFMVTLGVRVLLVLEKACTAFGGGELPEMSALVGIRYRFVFLHCFAFCFARPAVILSVR